MKKLFLTGFALLLALSYGCGSGGAGASSNEPKPVLHEVEESGYRYLADENGIILYSLEAPYITVDMDRKVFVVNSHVYYAPGTTYYNSFYDGFNIECGGHPRAGVEEFKVDFGSEGGELIVPKSPYENCSFNAFVVDREGTVFKTDINTIYFTSS